jgi:hypothetical protein
MSTSWTGEDVTEVLVSAGLRVRCWKDQRGSAFPNRLTRAPWLSVRAFWVVTTPAGAETAYGVDDAGQPQVETASHEQSPMHRVVPVSGQEHVAESQ